MSKWPKDKLLRHSPKLPLDELIRRYHHNIRAIRESGCAVPSALADTFDPAEIELWFADSAYRVHRLDKVIDGVAKLPPEAELPSPFRD